MVRTGVSPPLTAQAPAGDRLLPAVYETLLAPAADASCGTASGFIQKTSQRCPSGSGSCAHA